VRGHSCSEDADGDAPGAAPPPPPPGSQQGTPKPQ
jgi:hypothetical protein